MTNTTIFAIIALTGILILGTLGLSHDTFAQTDAIVLRSTDGAKAIPDWVDNNFRWYGEGLIEQTDLLNSLSYMLDNGFMHMSDKAAQETADLRAENAELRSNWGNEEYWIDITMPDGISATPGSKFDIKEHPTDDSDDSGRVKVQFHWDEETEQEALHHLRKAYDLNSNFQTKVVQFDNNHDKWIDVLSIDWGSSSSEKDCSAAEVSSDENSSCWIRVSQVHTGEEIWPDEYGATSSGDPDRPLITGQVYNSETTDDRPTEEVAFYYNKIASASETVHDLVSNGETDQTLWGEAITEVGLDIKNESPSSSASDGIHELGHALGMMNNAIEKEIQTIEGEVTILGDLMDMFTSTSTSSTRATNQYNESDFEFISRYTSQIDTKIQSLQTGLGVLEDMLATSDENSEITQEMQMQLQDAMNKQQMTLQTLKEKTAQIDADGEFWFTDLSPGY